MTDRAMICVTNRRCIPLCGITQRFVYGLRHRSPDTKTKCDSNQKDGRQLPEVSTRAVCEDKQIFHRSLWLSLSSILFLAFGCQHKSPTPNPSILARAGNGNRTRMASLEGWNFTIKLCPRVAENCAAHA